MAVSPLPPPRLLPQASCAYTHHFTDFAGGERTSKVIHIDLKKRPIPSIWTRSFLRCFRSHNLLWAARPAVPLPTKSQKIHFWYPPLFAVCFELSELANRSWYLPQLSTKLVTERHQQDDPAAIFYLLFDLDNSCLIHSNSRKYKVREESGKLVLSLPETIDWNQDGGHCRNECTRLAKKSGAK